MQLRLAIALLLLTATLTLADTDAELFQKIVGAWSERHHDMIYLQNGEWRLSKNGEATPGVMRWWIKDGCLIEFRDGVTFPPGKIIWVTPNEFFLQDANGGHSAPYYRH